MSAAAQLPPAAPDKYLQRGADEISREFYRRLEGGAPVTTRCRRCGRASFPPRARCASCGATTEWIDLPREGTLEAFTTQETAVRFAAPAVLALARVGEVVVPGIARGAYHELSVGAAVTLATFREPETGLTLLEFTPPIARRRRVGRR